MTVRAIERTGDTVRIIDQTKLPIELVYHTIGDYSELADAIRTLEIRGAPAIGIAAAYGIALAVQQTRETDIDAVARIGEMFKSTRPTAVNLFWAADRMVRTARELCGRTIDEMVSALWAEAESIHREDQEMCRRIGEYGAELVPHQATILTHCNAGALATGGIGTALGVIYVCREQGKRIRVYADETRPLLQGARLTAWELKQAGIEVTVLCDNAAGFLMQRRSIDCVIVGADRIAGNGDTANKIGTYGLSVLAERHRIPFYVAAPSSTFADDLAEGSQIQIEERSGIEVTEGFGVRTAPDGIEVYSPAFDVTPNELVTAFITDTGVRRGGRSGGSRTADNRLL